MQFTISESAKSKLDELLTTRTGPRAARVGLRAGGCRGFEQLIELGAMEMPEDEVINYDSLTILMYKKSAVLLAGAILEWKKSLTESRFVITFPDNKPICSCGKSFSI